MKVLTKITTLCFVVALAIGVSSCNKDVCYECTGFDDGQGNSLEDLGTVCEGKDGSEEEVQASIALYEGFGGTCSKK